jgi:spore coat polysaccharide biosynthesis protein SpsF
MPRIIASIEARMGSSRLPGKALMDVCGQPALTRLLRRLQRAKQLDGIVLATTISPADEQLVSWAEQESVDYYRGSEEDVLLRVVNAHRQMNSDIIVEITGDCPLLDPELVDLGITTFIENECDVVANVRKLSFPMGLDVQVFRFNDLVEVEQTVHDPAVREHVSLYFYEHPERYRIFNFFAPPRWTAPEYRFNLDYPEDLQFIRELYRRLEPIYGGTFGTEEIMALLKSEPELIEINRHCVEKSPR